MRAIFLFANVTEEIIDEGGVKGGFKVGKGVACISVVVVVIVIVG